MTTPDEYVIVYLNGLDINTKEINISGYGLSIMPDLSRFKKLTTLYCVLNYIKNLNNLPSTLEHLFCDKNPIVSLNNLPSSLKYISFSNTKITNLTNLPLTIKSIICEDNELLSLDYLPSSTTELYCKKNYINKLDNLPLFLTKLDCSFNKIKKINDLPYTIKYLVSYKNKITKLNNLPKSIKNIYNSYNVNYEWSKNFFKVCPIFCLCSPCIFYNCFLNISYSNFQNFITKPSTNCIACCLSPYECFGLSITSCFILED